MHQFFSHRRIGAHREGELALKSGKKACSFDNPVAKEIEFFKCPPGFPGPFLNTFSFDWL
jgi:hypothetical protein